MFARRLALAMVATALAAGSIIAYGAPAYANVPSANPATVAAQLGANKVPAALVLLVDISDSMAASNGGLYPQVQTEVPRFLSALAKQDPQDRVAVVVFGNRSATKTIYPLGRPTPNIPLPSNATSLGTDIGYAFQVALQNLAQAPKNIQVGGVLLLSDGGIWAPDDPVYDGGLGFNAPGWATLRKQVQGLGIPVTGYGLPLTTNPGDINALQQALTACFGAQQIMLSPNFSNLGSQLDVAQQKILNTRVAAAAGPDSGRGVKVTWNGPITSGGAVQLDLPSGHANLSVTLAAGTTLVPLHVNHLSIQANGFPANVTATISESDIALTPGHPVTVPVQLSWPPVTGNSAVAAGGTRSWSGRLMLSGDVYSPFTNAIKNYYLDKSFTVGGLSGSADTSYLATIPAGLNPLLLLLIILLVLALGGGAIIIPIYRSRLQGVLILNTINGQGGPLTLLPWPWYSHRIDRIVGIPGVIHVRGNPRNREMQIKLRNSTLPNGQNKLAPGGRTIISGLIVTHEDKAAQQVSPSSYSNAANSEPRQW